MILTRNKKSSDKESLGYEASALVSLKQRRRSMVHERGVMNGHSVHTLIRELYQTYGGDPDALSINPSLEKFGVFYRIGNGDKEVNLYRRDIDDRRFEQIERLLQKLL